LVLTKVGVVEGAVESLPLVLHGSRDFARVQWRTQTMRFSLLHAWRHMERTTMVVLIRKRLLGNGISSKLLTQMDDF